MSFFLKMSNTITFLQSVGLCFSLYILLHSECIILVDVYVAACNIIAVILWGLLLCLLWGISCERCVVQELTAETEKKTQLEMQHHRVNLAYADVKSQIQHGDYKIENYDRVKKSVWKSLLIKFCICLLTHISHFATFFRQLVEVYLWDA